MMFFFFFFFFKQKTAYEISVRDWSSDVCSSDLRRHRLALVRIQHLQAAGAGAAVRAAPDREERVGLEPRDRRDRDGGGEGADQISSVHGGHEESAKRRESARRRAGVDRPPCCCMFMHPPA